MIRHRRFLLVMKVLFVSLFVVAGAQAAEEGGGTASEKAAEIFKWINFAIVAGFILWLCFKKAPAFFSRRASAISSAIKSATDLKAAADAQLREAETKLVNLQKEVAELRALAERESAAEAARLRAATGSDAQKIAWPWMGRSRCWRSSSIHRRRKRSSAAL